MSKKNIAVLAGGYSGEAVSLFRVPTVMENLDRDLFNPILVRIDKDRWWVDVEGSPSIDKEHLPIQVANLLTQYSLWYTELPVKTASSKNTLKNYTSHLPQGRQIQLVVHSINSSQLQN